MDDGRRIKRVSAEYFEELSKMLITEINEPKLKHARVTEVSFTKDLHLARVYYVVDGENPNVAEADKGFKKCRGFLKRELSQRIPLRYAPDLEFIFDDKYESNLRLEKIFSDLDKTKEKAE
ncbi:30S ribosome-binding factor RbfA [bacterium]|nr:30S ribosome-binding factor RbfA [bacterium]